MRQNHNIELLSPTRRHLQWITAQEAEDSVNHGNAEWSRRGKVVVVKNIPAVMKPASTISFFEMLINADLSNCSPPVRKAIKFKVANYKKIH